MGFVALRSNAHLNGLLTQSSFQFCILDIIRQPNATFSATATSTGTVASAALTPTDSGDANDDALQHLGNGLFSVWCTFAISVVSQKVQRQGLGWETGCLAASRISQEPRCKSRLSVTVGFASGIGRKDSFRRPLCHPMETVSTFASIPIRDRFIPIDARRSGPLSSKVLSCQVTAALTPWGAKDLVARLNLAPSKANMISFTEPAPSPIDAGDSPAQGSLVSIDARARSVTESVAPTVAGP